MEFITYDFAYFDVTSSEHSLFIRGTASLCFSKEGSSAISQQDGRNAK